MSVRGKTFGKMRICARTIFPGVHNENAGAAGYFFRARCVKNDKIYYNIVYDYTYYY